MALPADHTVLVASNVPYKNSSYSANQWQSFFQHWKSQFWRLVLLKRFILLRICSCSSIVTCIGLAFHILLFFSSQACLAWALHKASKCCMPWWRISRVAHNLPSGCLHPHFSLLFTCLDYHSCTCLPALAISQATARALIAPHSSSLKSAREPVTSSTMPFLAPPGNATHYAPVGTILNPFLTDQKCIILTPEQDLSNNHCILGSSSHCILLSPSGSSCKISRPPSQRHWRPAHPLYIPLGN